MITTLTSRGSTPNFRSCAAIACSGSISTLYSRPRTPPRFCLGSTATEAWKPVSMRMLPTPGCSTRNAGTGMRNQPSRGDRRLRRAFTVPPVIAISSDGELTHAETSGRSATVAPSRPPSSGLVRRLGVASAKRLGLVRSPFEDDFVDRLHDGLVALVEDRVVE